MLLPLTPILGRLHLRQPGHGPVKGEQLLLAREYVRIGIHVANFDI